MSGSRAATELGFELPQHRACPGAAAAFSLWSACPCDLKVGPPGPCVFCHTWGQWSFHALSLCVPVRS